MSGYIEGKIDTKQYSFLPTCYDEMISEDNPVRVFNAFVDSLDMTELNFKNADRQKEKAGRPSYNPKDLLKLYIYGYFNGIRSSRKLAKECERNIELFWLINQLKPDFRTISDFRKNNINNIKFVFKEFSILCDSLDLIGKEIVAIDGSKFRANNGRKENYTKGKIEKQIKYYEENITKYLEILDKEDIEEKDNKVNISKSELNKKIEETIQRIKELQTIKEDIENTGEISITDPDSRHMKSNNNGTDISHNVQIAVDNKSHIVVAVDVTSSPADQGQLSNMAIKAKEELNVKELTVLADKGYWNGEELKKCEENNINTIVSSPEESGNIGYKKSDFKYNEKEDTYVCPAGKILNRTGDKNRIYANYKECKTCPYKDKCTKSKRGRRLSINENEEYLESARKRQLENMDLYKQRQMIVEHVFGTIKRDLGYTYLLLRKNEKVKGESFMHFLIYNIKRVCNIKTVKEIIEAIMIKKAENSIKNFNNILCFSNFFEERVAEDGDPYIF